MNSPESPIVNPHISVVIPIYNEEDNLPELHRRLKDVLGGKLQVTYEMIFVDDGSYDNSWNVVKDLRRQNAHVKGIRFSRNFGHHTAISAGLNHSEGNVVVMMDGDLQDPPEEIPKLYRKLKEGYDIVYAIRDTRKDPILKKVASKFFYRVFRLLANVEIFLDCGIFRVMSRRSVDALRACQERSRLITALMSWTGFSHIGVRTERTARYAGKTKYSLFKSVILAIDGITSFSYFPLRLATYFGFVAAIISSFTGIYMLVKKLFYGIPILGYASIIVSVLFIGGVQLVIIGIMGEYVGRIYTEVQNRPMYIIEEKLGVD